MIIIGLLMFPKLLQRLLNLEELEKMQEGESCFMVRNH